MSLAVDRLPRPTSNILTIISCLFLAALPSYAVTGYIRVNQIGYEASLSMRAYLMTTSAVSSVSYAVKNSGGTTVASGSAGATLGKWGSYSVYPIDFMLSTADTYTITVSGPVSATSPGFRVDTPANLYTTPLANNLYFYENERDGPNFISTPLRTAAGHLNDASATVYNSPSFNSNDLILGSLSPTGATINAEGGWWDAGDYLKFVQTHSYVVALMLIGIRDFPNQMGGLSTASNFTNEAQFGLSWLQQMWNDSTQTLYYQVGIGTDFKSSNYLSDHDIWRLPQADDLMEDRTRNISTFGIAQYSWVELPGRRSVRISQDALLPTLQSAFRYTTRRILHWPINVFLRQNTFSILPILLQQEIC
jgi:endoglucanase